MAINPVLACSNYFDVDEPFTAVGFVGKETLEKGRWGQSTIVPHGYGDAAFTILAKSATRFGALSLMRAADFPDYEHGELELLRLLAPHIRRAVMISDLLDSRTLERDTLSAALDLVQAGVVLTDGFAKVVHANTAARQFIDGKLLRIVDDELWTPDSVSSVELRDAIASAATENVGAIPKAGSTVVARNANGKELAMWVLPLDSALRRDIAAPFSARAAVFMRELGDTSPFPAELFIKRYGITAAECRLLMLLVQGKTLQEASDILGVSLATSKTHTAKLFQKTGTQRQAELLRLAVSALAPAAAPR